MIAAARDDDADLLDAYSRAVVDVVERAGPAADRRRDPAHRAAQPGQLGRPAARRGDALHRALRTWPAGQSVRLTVIRRGGRLAVDIVPAWAGA